jgi:hypothetical protein
VHSPTAVPGGSPPARWSRVALKSPGQDHISFQGRHRRATGGGLPALQLARQRGDRMHGDDRRTGSVVGQASWTRLGSVPVEPADSSR